MKKVKFSIDGGLEKKDLDMMWDAALKLIGNHGLKIPHKGINDIISNFDGVLIKNDIVTFDSELVLKAIKSQDYSDWPEKVNPDSFGMVSGAYIKEFIDLENGSNRPANMQDLIDCTKLCEAYGLYGPPCVRPNEEPVELQRLLMYKTSYEYSRTKGHGIFDVAGWLNPREARIGKEMADAAGKDFRIDLWLISPFLAPHTGLDILYEFRNEPVDMNVTNMPTTGTTAPINMIDAYIQSIAEIFAGLTLIYLINENKTKKGKIRTVVIDSIRAYPFDMKYGLFVYGSAEDVLGTLYQSQINKYFGIPLVAKSLLTTGKLPDSHAAAEKAAHTIVGALCGATMFSNAGLLSVDEVFSVEQVVIDYEIVKFCKRIIEGNSFDEKLSAVEVIKEIGFSGTFMTHDTTLFNYKENLWDPELFLHSSLEQWKRAGSKDTMTLAKEIALEKIKNQNYIINEDMKKKLDRIYSNAKKELFKG